MKNIGKKIILFSTLFLMSACTFDFKTMAFYFDNKTSQDSFSNENITNNFLSPSKDVNYWQEYDHKKFYEEDFSSKKPLYQFTLIDSELSEGRKYDVLINLFEDGEFVISQYGLTNKVVMDYYGYWANIDNEYIYAGISCYSSSTSGEVYNISYSYNLTKTGNKFDTFGINLSLGFAEGGVYVRNKDITGDGNVKYNTLKDFENEYNLTRTDKLPYQEPKNDEEDNTLFSWTSDSENYLLTFNKDGTYLFQFKTASLKEEGTWSFVNWKMKIVNSKNQEIEAVMDNTTHAFTLEYVSGISDRVKRTFTCESSIWGKALGSSGTYKIPTKLLFSWTSDSENYLLDFYNDNTYIFQFKTASLKEEGTWSFVNWKMKIINSKNQEIEATLDSTTHAFTLEYVSGISDRVKRTFTCESSIWGKALGSSGTYIY